MTVWAVVGGWEAGRFLLPEIDLCGSPLTLASGNLDPAEDPVVYNDILPHQVGGVGAPGPGRRLPAPGHGTWPRGYCSPTRPHVQLA